MKPEDGGGGRDIFLLESRDGALVRRRGQAAEPFEPASYLRTLQNSGIPRATLVERRMLQAPFWNELFPGSANTIRVLTLWTPGEPAPFVAHAVQRMGTADTVPTDSWSGGGISAPVSLDTGRLGVGRTHPLKGARLPFNPVSGWDVIVDRDGQPVILEANANSDIDLHQVHGGLLADARVRRFYQAVGVV